MIVPFSSLPYEFVVPESSPYTDDALTGTHYLVADVRTVDFH